MQTFFTVCVGVVCFLCISAPVFGESVLYTLGFDSVSNNEVGDVAIGEAQLSVDVVDIGVSDQVEFVFKNSGPEASSIADIYFEDGPLLAIAQIIDSGTGGDDGVSFSEGASPGDLPSGNNASPPFSATREFDADSDSPVQQNGVNPGEQLGIVFNLVTGQTVSDVVTALNTAPAPDVYSLRIGIHVQGFASGGSEAFVNTPPTSPPTPTPGILPEPSSWALLGSAVVVLGAFFCRKKKRFPRSNK